MKRTLFIILVVAVVIGGGAFYGGIKYGQSIRQNSGGFGQNFQNLSSEQRQQLIQENAGATLQRGNGRGVVANFVSGEVIAKDEQSLTLKMPDGGSKIIFFSASTIVSKMSNSLIEDIEIGKQIMVRGEQNSDGSYTAQTIQEGQLPL